MEGGTRAREGGSRGFGSGGVGGRGTGPRKFRNTRTKRRKMIFLRIPCGVGGGTRARKGGFMGFGSWGGRW